MVEIGSDATWRMSQQRWGMSGRGQSVIVPDRELEEGKKPGESEPPRIRCPLCPGRPARGTNGSASADIRGIPLIRRRLPACLHPWAEICCVRFPAVCCSARIGGLFPEPAFDNQLVREKEPAKDGFVVLSQPTGQV